MPVGGPGPGERQDAADQLMLLTGEAPIFTQVIRGTRGSERLPPPRSDHDQELREVATGARSSFYADRVIDGAHVRVHVTRGPDGHGDLRGAVAGARSTVRSGRCAGRCGILALAGIALAAALSRLATRTAIRPVVPAHRDG